MLVMCKIFLCSGNLVFTKSTPLGKKSFGSRGNRNTVELRESRTDYFHQLVVPTGEGLGLALGLHERPPGQGGFALVLMHMLWPMT